MSRRDRVYVGHMLDMARKVQARVRDRDRVAFDADEDLRLAITHLLQTIGEAASRVSPGYRAAHPDLPWDAIVGMGHRVVHDYMNVDEDVVWKTAIEDVDSLSAVLERLIADES